LLQSTSSADQLLSFPFRFLDPLLCILLDPKSARTKTTSVHNGRRFEVVAYAASSNIRRKSYVFENLLKLQSAGGASFITSLRSTPFHEASDELQDRSRSCACPSAPDLKLNLTGHLLPSQPGFLTKIGRSSMS
jgi:hypothetical protein